MALKQKIGEWQKKIIFRKKEILLTLIFILSCSFFFALGYLAAGKQNIAPIIIEKYSN